MSYNDFIKLLEAAFDFFTSLFTYFYKRLLFALIALKNWKNIELRLNFDTIFHEHMFELVYRDRAAVISISFFETIVCFLFSDFGIGVLEKTIEIMESNLIFVFTKSHGIHDFRHI